MDARVSQELALKIKLEEKLKPKLRRWFKTVSKDLRVSWAVDRRIPDLSDERIVLQGLLKDHYRIVAKTFKRRTRDFLAKKYNFLEFKVAEEDLIDYRVVAYLSERAKEAAEIIIETTVNQIKEISAAIITTDALLGTPSDPEREAIAIKEDFDSRINGRVDTIALTETQGMAERTKLIEARTISEEEDSGLFGTYTSSTGTTKDWNTILDQKTRNDHARADGQRQNIDEPFIVGGEKLMVPGDWSMGASAGNIINCRCSVTYNA